MLTPEQIDKLPNRVMEYWEQAEYDIIADIARRMQKAGQVTNTAEWQMWRLKEVGIARSDILTILASTLNKSQGEIIKSFDECCTEALNSDDKLYKEAGFTPIPLQDNPLMQGIILAGLKETNGTYQNLTATTANTASRQFENILDQMNLRIASGAFTYQEAIKAGISELSQQGIQSITYPSGHIDYLDVAFRRATVTGMSKTANNLQMQRLDELDIDLVEVTAHPGCLLYTSRCV